MRWLCLLLTIVCPLSWAVAQTAANIPTICRINTSKPECRTGCATPASCMNDCLGCTDACVAANCWETADLPGQGPQNYIQKLPEELREKFLDSLKIEGKKIDVK